MPLPGRIFAGDEELGKKDDDHRRTDGTIPVSAWSWTRWPVAPRVRRRRLFVVFILGLVIYVFFKNIPSDLGPVAHRIDTRVPGQTFGGMPLAIPKILSRKPPHPEGQTESEKHYFNGQIKFYKLASSLHGIARTMGYREKNKNVLFAAASLQSASRLIPMACEMSRWDRNAVHFAFMGRDDLPISDIQVLNGVGPDCDVYWHDARPDYTEWSTKARMELSVTSGLGHIHSFMHPQAYIIDDNEDSFFVKSIRSKGFETGKPIIELPSNAVQRMMWITRLDHGSLQAWHKSYVEILIHAPTESSGSIIRLLESIEEADYFGSRRPHITIELPPDIDPPTSLFLQNFVWPPLDPSGSPHVSQVTLRHRIPRHQVGSEEASVRFVESFYSARPHDSHVLVLSPQVQLSPLYYHYLFYNILEYAHAAYSSNEERRNLMGISLDLPSRSLDDQKPFSPPPSKPDSHASASADPAPPPPFLWQAPNSNAALYFGDKWAEFHSFLSSRILAQHTRQPHRPRLISPKYPSWTEYLLELMRARGYTLLYPNLPSDALATVHTELYHPPEESPAPLSPDDSGPQPLNPNEPFTVDPASPPPIQPPPAEKPPLSSPLLTLLPHEGDLPDLSTLPLLTHIGAPTDTLAAKLTAAEFAEAFQQSIGGCKSGTYIPPALMNADDLFCFDVNDADDNAEDMPEEGSAEGRGQKALPVSPAETLAERREITREFLAHLARQGGGTEGAKEGG
ncbi:hypothetical protein MMC13_001064 [Lambiella insularis]|nr:hypothetical protein [Lambiella insularis]